MKKNNLFTTLSAQITAIAVSSVTSCGLTQQKASADKPYKAIVVTLTDVDTNGAAKFGLLERTFNSLTDLDQLDGTYAKFLRGGQLSVKEVNGSIVSADTFSGGENPNLRYSIKDGVVVASDYSSLAMLSSYYQFDYIYSNVKSVLGIEPADLQTKLPSGKHTVLFEPQISFNLSTGSGTAGIKLNAAFSPKDKQFLLFQRSGIESIPLSSNLQVISHEFGHSLFDFAFLDGKYEDKNYTAESYSMRGLNEGWADFISWSFTNCPDILRSSINIAEIANSRHITNSTFKWENIVNQSLSDSAYQSASDFGKCRGSFYCIGTLFARSLIATKTALPSVEKKVFASGLISSLKLAQAEVKAMPVSIVTAATEDDQTDPDSSLRWSRQGTLTGAFLRAIVKNSPNDWKSKLCQNFAENFGTGGFPEIARSGVCP
ncbi:MAG: hypothetical protein NT027_13830 [Proteobacteria bacterium]|nr:hypothetical protein [Pseudomonadota bacterium]